MGRNSYSKSHQWMLLRRCSDGVHKKRDWIWTSGRKINWIHRVTILSLKNQVSGKERCLGEGPSTSNLCLFSMLMNWQDRFVTGSFFPAGWVEPSATSHGNVYLLLKSSWVVVTPPRPQSPLSPFKLFRSVAGWRDCSPFCLFSNPSLWSVAFKV